MNERHGLSGATSQQRCGCGAQCLTMVLRAAGLNPGLKLLYLPKMLLHVEVLDKKENTAVLQKHLQHPCLVTGLLNKKIRAVIKA